MSRYWLRAPDDAVGYRVVLPGRDEWDAPRVVPDPNVMGSPSFWRLRPFQLPDDIRLRAGSCIDCCGWMRRACWFLLLGIATCQRFDFFWDHRMMHASSNPFRQDRDAVV